MHSKQRIRYPVLVGSIAIVGGVCIQTTGAYFVSVGAYFVFEFTKALYLISSDYT
jgi:hypothetical protein